MGWERERVEIDRSGRGGDWGGGDRRSGVGWGESGDRQEDRGGRGREWG